MPLLEDFSGDLSAYTGDTNDFTLDSSTAVAAGQALHNNTANVGITHTEWEIEYGESYTFYFQGAGSSEGDIGGLYLGDTRGGLNSMSGVVVGADVGYGSIDIATISGGSIDWEEYASVSLDLETWQQYEVIVDDPSQTGAEYTLRLLDGSGNVDTEISNTISTYPGTPQYIGFATAASSSHWDEVETTATPPFLNISFDGSVSGTADLTVSRAQNFSLAGSASGTADLSVSRGQSLSLSGTVTDAGGSPLEGVTVIGVNETQGAVQEITTTDTAGEYTLTYPAGDEAHVLFEHDDGAIRHTFESKPFIAVEEVGLPDEENLLAHWDFSQADATDGETYAAVPDRSGNGHDLTGEGATHATDGINGLPAAHFDGTDDYLVGPTPDALDIGSDDITKSVYLAWRSLDASHTGYIMTQTINGSRSLQEFSHIFYGGRDEVDFSLGGTVTATPDLLDTNPHTTAALIDRPSGDATLSWDGTVQATTTGPESPADAPIRLGARGATTSSGVGTFYHGYIGEVLIYDGIHDLSTHDDVMAHLDRWTP